MENQNQNKNYSCESRIKKQMLNKKYGENITMKTKTIINNNKN